MIIFFLRYDDFVKPKNNVERDGNYIYEEKKKRHEIVKSPFVLFVCFNGHPFVVWPYLVWLLRLTLVWWSLFSVVLWFSVDDLYLEEKEKKKVSYIRYYLCIN
jgi:hypothetical protein